MKRFFLFLLLIGAFFLTNEVNAQCDKACLESQINEYKQKISQLQTQANTLSNQVAQFNAQISLSQLKVEQTQDQIELLSNRIDQVQGSLDDLKKAFSARAVATYKMARTSEPAYLVLSSEDLTDAISKYHYLKEAEDSDRELLGRLQSAQDSYIDSKKESEELEKQLKAEQITLSSQKAAKQQLLSSTKNDEKKYQELLNQAMSEYLAIQGILAGNGKETEVGRVGAGEKIASIIQGPSCNSSGAHLHFTVSQNGTTRNPFEYLKNVDNENCSGSSCNSGDGDPFNPSGSWDWPINPRIQFSQGYGSTWAVRNTYVGRIYSAHNGIDIDSDSPEVKAVQGGVLFRGSYSGTGGCSLRYVRIHHDDGLDAFYLHVNY